MGNESNNRVKGVTVVERSATQRVRVPKFYFPRINIIRLLQSLIPDIYRIEQ